jgi:hypothetical protein
LFDDNELLLPADLLLPELLYDPKDRTLPADEYGPRLWPRWITFFYDVNFFAFCYNYFTRPLLSSTSLFNFYNSLLFFFIAFFTIFNSFSVSSPFFRTDTYFSLINSLQIFLWSSSIVFFSSICLPSSSEIRFFQSTRSKF